METNRRHATKGWEMVQQTYDNYTPNISNWDTKDPSTRYLGTLKNIAVNEEQRRLCSYFLSGRNLIHFSFATVSLALMWSDFGCCVTAPLAEKKMSEDW